MESELDYDLIERVGATHFDSESSLFKFDEKGSLCYWVPRAKAYARHNVTSLDVYNLGLRLIPPRPAYEYVKKEFDEPWEAGKAICSDVELWCKAKDDRFYKLTTQPSAVKHSQKGALYARKEIKPDWKKAVGEFIESAEHISCDERLGDVATKTCAIDEVYFNNEFLELCRVVLREIGELE